jgi:hypothetical protein
MTRASSAVFGYQSRALLGITYDGLRESDRARESYETAVAVGMRHVERPPRTYAPST